LFFFGEVEQQASGSTLKLGLLAMLATDKKRAHTFLSLFP
jgi:hypothetical protein